jgi:lactate dehydrogenase-like 2-hydroxyacid dehydrogenase
MTKPAVLFTGAMMDMVTEQVAKSYSIHNYWEAADKAAFLAKVGPGIEALATGGHTGVKTDAALLAALPKLRVIANFGVGYDSIDVDAAAKRGIIVTNTPDVLTEEVADTALGLLLMTVRELSKAEAWLRAGHWADKGDYRLTPASLRDRSLGMVGMGRIGQAIATRCAAFGMPICYFARSKRAEVSYPYYSNLIQMAQAVDTLMVITPGGPETKNMINAEVLAALGPRGILINVARGTVVDETALIAALRNKTILAAGLDVFWNEPKINRELMTLDNATLLPHVGSGTIHTRNGMGQMVVDNLAAYAARAQPVSPVAETPFKAW